MLEQTQDNEQVIERIAALDIGKAELVCCARVPGPRASGKRLQEVTIHSTMTRSLLAMADRLRQLGVTRVVMEATGVIRGLILENRTLPRWIRGGRVRDRSDPPGRRDDHA
jgi:hypothetical protein